MLPQEEIQLKIFRERKKFFPHLVYSQFLGREKGNKKEKERADGLFEILPKAVIFISICRLPEREFFLLRM